jgi:hypothetical protein
MKRSEDDEAFRRSASEILGDTFLIDTGRFAKARAALGRIRYPWDGVLFIGITIGLYLAALLGAMITLWAHGSVVGLLVGLPLVYVAASIAAHLVPKSPTRG